MICKIGFNKFVKKRSNVSRKISQKDRISIKCSQELLKKKEFYSQLCMRKTVGISHGGICRAPGVACDKGTLLARPPLGRPTHVERAPSSSLHGALAHTLRLRVYGTHFSRC